MIDLQALELRLPVSDAASNIARHGEIAPSRILRELDNDNYFTIDSPWIIPALMSKVPIAGSVLEPAAGLGHMVIELRRGHGLAVTASDLHAYPDPLIPDIEIRDLRSIDTLSGFNWAITNLPYRDQDVLAAHLVELGARDGCNVALLTRAEWIVAESPPPASASPSKLCWRRSPDVATTLNRELFLASPRHNFIWAVWSAEPRPPGVDAWVRFADRRLQWDSGANGRVRR